MARRCETGLSIARAAGYGLRVAGNRMKFLLAGPILDAVNPRLPGHPHERLVGLVGEGPMTVLDLCAGTGYLGGSSRARTRSQR